MADQTINMYANGGDLIPLKASENSDGTYSFAPPKRAAATSAIVTSDGTALAANASRKGFSIQNVNDAAVYVKLGAGCSSSDFSFVLKAGSAADDGNGGFYSDLLYTGIVTIAAKTGSPRVVVCEL